jgi:hypothetical protein
MVEMVVQRASGRLGELRAMAAAAIRGGPAGVLPILVAALLVASSAAVLILSVVPSPGHQPALNLWVRGTAAGICALIGVGYLAVRVRSPQSAQPARPSRDSDEGMVTGMLSLAVLLLLLLVPIYLLAARTHPPTEDWIGYGFFDKRWLVATFLLGSIGAMIVITAVAQVVRGAAPTPGSWRGWASGSFSSAAAPAPGVGISSISLKRSLVLVGAGVLLAAYFFAPPWHISLTNVNIHETPMMAGVQGIANGATPYIGSGAVQYGPGSELIQYLYLHTFGFDLESFRQSTVFLYWIAATMFFAVVFLRLPPRLALITSLVAILIFPTLEMISFQPTGAVDAEIDKLHDAARGVWGWPNAMRYIGVFSVSMLFPAVAAMKRPRTATLAGIALGVLFGLTCYISQENLIGGVIAMGALALLLVLTQTVPARMVWRGLFAVGIGFASVAAVVFAYYAANGELGRFLELYYLIPPAVAAGYSDTLYYGGFGAQWGPVYYLLPFLLGALCVLSVIRLHPLRVARQWSRERVLLVSALVASCVALTASFLRSDSSHLVNTMLALPVALVLAVAYLPGLLGIGSQRRRLTTAVALAAIPLALLPFTQIRNIGNRLSWPTERFSYQSPALQWQRADPNSIAARRLGPMLHAPEQWCCTTFKYPVSMREFASILNRVHAVVGDRRVYVANFLDGTQPGAAYFLADLKPADIYFEPFTMAMNQDLLNQFLDYFQAHISGVQAIVAVYPNLPEVRMFKAAYPNYRETRLPYTWGSITVLTR